MAKRPCKYQYLKNWPEFPEPRPVILDCQASRSGMSMAVWDRETKLFTVGGCGFDRIGAAIGTFLENVYQDELLSFFNKQESKPYGSSWLCFPEFYGALLNPQDQHIHLDGACGESSMQAVGKALGLKIKTYDSHSATLIHITKL